MTMVVVIEIRKSFFEKYACRKALRFFKHFINKPIKKNVEHSQNERLYKIK